ncbi:MAG TPA: peptidoglycan bridge formation glycyltransferase FemA/FemB family protein [Chthoniobacterales bacterium]|nr:peptidoglycan bridge formation glycyltransferase FemA/FemB family protein [Chthoniobacterales bacterium]
MSPVAEAVAPPTNAAAPATTDPWQAWDCFLAERPDAGFMQSSWWADFRTVFGFEHFAAILKHDGVPLGGAVVMKFSREPESCFYYIPDGPVLPEDPEIAEAVFHAVMQEIGRRREVEDKTVSHLRIEPRWERLPPFVSGFRSMPVLGDAYMEPRNTIYVDLRPLEREMLARMKPKGRYNIKLAQRHGVTVVEDTSTNGLADFLAIYGETAARQGLKPKSAHYFETLLELGLPQRRAALWFAEHAGVRLATAVVVYFGRRATYLYGGSLTRDRHLMAPYVLHWEIMRAAKANGFEFYDLWGVAPPDEPDHPWGKITAFKRRFGGEAVNFVPTLDYVYDDAAYERYRRG